MLGLRYLDNVATLQLAQEKCTGCTMCTKVCPHAVFVMEEKKAKIKDLNACMECGACMKNCPAAAITVRTGVGCAAGVINGFLKGTEATCDCGGADGGSACC